MLQDARLSNFICMVPETHGECLWSEQAYALSYELRLRETKRVRTVVKALSGQFTAGLSHSVCRMQREAEKCRLSRTIMIFGNGMVVRGG